ncbi:CPBP family intramembrane metalloprotease [Cytophagales bacterium LB-30]|uniref:CPBP family intramembrane metalloprotease n=1 Tax=Shiella aurantiaca TaxID=3058365 RepID=A0ABT8F792_9BACT|nr:CPBP family intramembrane glutamic endopeptidase [Shiella aurantiaca]MDN4166076.1 CPBP family intramembrane metalloprotease [Shiella aurantiaca]
MQKYAKSLEESTNQSVWASLFLFILFISLGMVFGSFLGLIVAFPLTGLSVTEFISQLETGLSGEQFRIPLLILQGITSAVMFLLMPWIFLRLVEKTDIRGNMPSLSIGLRTVGLVLGATFAGMLFISWVYEWNMQLELPAFLDGFEQWARQMEDQMAAATEALTRMPNFSDFLLAFLVIAIIPGIGEELVFRGVLQNQLQRIAGNAHVGIWVSAFIFSAIHMQFYGFFPRLLLGAGFGYMYVFSGKRLLYPILAHLFNNGFTIVLAYAAQQGMVEYDLSEPSAAPWYVALLALLAFAGLLGVFRKYFLTEGEA